MRARIALVSLACACALAAAGCGDDGDGGAAAAPEPKVIWAIGDGGAPGERSRRIADLIAQDVPERVIYLGDVYERGRPEEFGVFGDVFGPLVKRMWPTPGNHDWPNHAAGYDPFWREALSRPVPYTYVHQVGGWELIAANSETPDDERQLAWLEEQMAGESTCRIAFWHRPRFSAGEHRDEEGAVARMYDAVKGRIAILLSGHDHNSQRLEPADGTVQYIAGAGGQDHYDVDESDPRLAFSDDTTDAALRIELSPGSADLRFIAVDGTELDRSTVTCRG